MRIEKIAILYKLKKEFGEKFYIDIGNPLNYRNNYNSSQFELSTLEKIKNFVKENYNYKEAWDKMGSTGADDYWERATRDELFDFGYFRAMEDVQDFLEKKEINENKNL